MFAVLEQRRLCAHLLGDGRLRWPASPDNHHRQIHPVETMGEDAN